MYPLYLRIDPSRKTTDPLATYTRLEYGTSDPTWILVDLRKARGPRFDRVRRWLDVLRRDGDSALAAEIGSGVVE